MFDEIDVTILTILQKNARTSNAEIARQVGMTASAVFGRIRRLEQAGVIRGYAAVVDPVAMGLPVLAYVFVRLSAHRRAREVGRALCAVPAVQEVAHLTGEDCFLAKVRCRDTAQLEEVVLGINDIEAVCGTRTVIAFRALREGGAVPVAPAAPAKG